MSFCDKGSSPDKNQLVINLKESLSNFSPVQTPVRVKTSIKEKNFFSTQAARISEISKFDQHKTGETIKLQDNLKTA